SSFSKSGKAKVEYRSSSMSSPSSTNDLQEAHWPSLHPCGSMTPCSKAARKTVWSSSTSISIPTGSNRTTCLSAMNFLARTPEAAAKRPSEPGRTRGEIWSFPASVFQLVTACPAAGLVSRRRRPSGRSLTHVVGAESLAFLVGHLVEEHVRALQVRHAP